MINRTKSLFSAISVLSIIAFCLVSFRLAPVTAPSVIIYKTKKDYSKYVPVTLSDDKSKVVNYPDIKDVYYEGQLAYPTELAKGYWLDHRGVNRHSAFLRLTYEEYSKLPATPSPSDLYNMILDPSPFREIYDMGKKSEYKDLVSGLNRIIENHELKKFKRLK